MPLYQINNKRPVIGEGTWIAPSAEIIGDVTIGRDCYIGFGAIIRGDFGKIEIGDKSLIEENVVIHVGTRAEIGSRVIVGHMVMIHDAVIKEGSLIGMKSMICDGAIVNKGSIIAEQSLVKKKQIIPSGKIYAGSPACEIGDIEDRHRDFLAIGHKAYMDLITQYHNTFKRLE